jgi:hypothetical protein
MTINQQTDAHTTRGPANGGTTAPETSPCQVTRTNIAQSFPKALDRVSSVHQVRSAGSQMVPGGLSGHRGGADMLRAANRSAQMAARSNPPKPRPKGVPTSSGNVLTQNNTQHQASSTNTYAHTSSGYVLPRQDTERWLRILAHRSNGAHGKAVVTLADWLSARGLIADLVAGCELALELIGSEEVWVCENLTTLLADGWELSLGELLTCARSL